jgi:hypothetical protein
MKATLRWLAVLAVLGGAASVACASGPPWWGCAIRQAPDTCGGCGWYNTHPAGMAYGPNYSLQPPYPPFNGMVFPPKQPNGGGPPAQLAFPTHPYARSPRDYFMIFDEPAR